ncbi:TPA: hypothetical protein ACXND4_001564, partial [Burkholderia multivorans]
HHGKCIVSVHRTASAPIRLIFVHRHPCTNPRHDASPPIVVHRNWHTYCFRYFRAESLGVELNDQR